MEIRPAVSRHEYERMNTRELRAAFLIEKLFTPGTIDLTLWECDRTILGSAVPLKTALELEAPVELRAEYFCERRELAVLNVGNPGAVMVDGRNFEMNARDCLYIGRERREVSFASADPEEPARFYLLSYPAHATHPTALVRAGEANQLQLGAAETANQRTVFQAIHEGGIRSCQLVMGFTQLASGGVWNTMPPHTHARRSEVYLYFGVADDSAVFHFMGPADETRHIVVRHGQAVLSPGWSIHCGCGTSSYSFVWGMGGENQQFSDMDPVAIADLR